MKKDFKLLFALYVIVSIISILLIGIFANVMLTLGAKDLFICSLYFIFVYVVLFLNTALAKALIDLSGYEK